MLVNYVSLNVTLKDQRRIFKAPPFPLYYYMIYMEVSLSCWEKLYNLTLQCTVEPPNKGHLGTRAGVPYSEVVLYSEVFGKIVFSHTNGLIINGGFT